MQPAGFEEQILFSTVRIVAEGDVSSDASIGTGFIVSTPLEVEGQSALVLVSCRHVVAGASRIALRFHKATESKDAAILGSTVALNMGADSPLIRWHPLDDVDLAGIIISLVGHQSFSAYFRHLRTDSFATFSEPELVPGAPVLFVGYPDGRFDTAHNLPLARRGWIASAPRVDFEERAQFVIDAPVHPGSSGSPVFLETSDRYKLVGVVSDYLIRKARIEAGPRSAGTNTRPSEIGLGIVIKVSRVAELLEAVAHHVHAEISSISRRLSVLGTPGSDGR